MDGPISISRSALFRPFVRRRSKRLKIPEPKRTWTRGFLTRGRKKQPLERVAVGRELGPRAAIPVRKELGQLATIDWMIGLALAHCSLALQVPCRAEWRETHRGGLVNSGAQCNRCS